MIWDIADKTIVVTGANSGIGKEAAAAFAERGARVVMVCRNPTKGEAAQREIVERTGSSTVELVIGDMSSVARVREAAAAVAEQCPVIDVLLNNAGFAATTRSENEDGLEQMFATNHIGYFLFTNLLLDNIKAAGEARIVCVASAAHRWARLNFDDLQWKKRSYRSMPAYGTTKLMNILFAAELARRLEDSGVTVNSLHPGVIASEFGTNAEGWIKKFWWLVKPFILTTKQGAQTSIHLCASPEVSEITGKYWAKSKIKKPRRIAENELVAKRLWDVSAEICSL